MFTVFMWSSVNMRELCDESHLNVSHKACDGNVGSSLLDSDEEGSGDNSLLEGTEGWCLIKHKRNGSGLMKLVELWLHNNEYIYIT